MKKYDLEYPLSEETQAKVNALFAALRGRKMKRSS